ncbi:MAG: PEGA domain-containing protein [Myxococcales bacterium]|nr:PEGA domain-containing protein [Myxococcales bacterium]
MGTIRYIFVASALAALAAVGVPSEASAQSCVLLRPGVPEGGAPAPGAASREALDAVTQQLDGDGITVIPAPDAEQRMVGEPYATCNRLECGADVARALGVDFVVLVTVWTRRGRATSVVVTLIGADDSVAGDAPVEAGDLAAAVLGALGTARQRWQAARMGYLLASSTPPGATIEVDGRVVGQTPLRHLVAAGEHRVRLLLDGHETHEETLVITPSEERPLEVALVPAQAVAPPTPVTREEPSFLNWILGGGLAALGVGLAISPIYGAALDGSCVGETPCELVHQFGTANGVLLGLSIASLGAGLVFLIAQPLQVTVSAGPSSARLSISGTF